MGRQSGVQFLLRLPILSIFLAVAFVNGNVADPPERTILTDYHHDDYHHKLVFSSAADDVIDNPDHHRPSKRSVVVRLRSGNATDTNSCQHVREVPSSLRSEAGISPSLAPFYQKYTEAYGIPVVASEHVPDDALQRACYVLRFLLAGHSGVRQSFYAHSGRVAVVGVKEGTVSMPEHSYLSKWYNQRARGLGATVAVPLSSAGEENILCYPNDRYHSEDIFLHETSHGVQTLGAAFAIAGWDARLLSQFHLVERTNLWADTYSRSTYLEYFAEGVQSYFNVNTYSAVADAIHGPISTPDRLKAYDPVLYSLIQEVLPCNNTYLKRCFSDRTIENEQDLRMDCNLGNGEGRIVSGQSTSTGNDTTSGHGGNGTTPTDKGCHDNSVYCPAWAHKGYCTDDPTSGHKTSETCRYSCDYCITNATDYHHHKDKHNGTVCVDHHPSCLPWASLGYCLTMPEYMMATCRHSCHVCGDDTIANNRTDCRDENLYCPNWAGQGYCSSRADYMTVNCKHSCGVCPTTNDTTTTTTTTTSPTTTTTGTVCLDLHSSCRYWAGLGYCLTMPAIKASCRRSCLVCGHDNITTTTTTSPTTTTPRTGCHDDNVMCGYWSSQGECSSNPDYMHVSCSKSCLLCEDATLAPPPECKNVEASMCEYWKSLGQCKLIPDYMRSRCAKTCQMC